LSLTAVQFTVGEPSEIQLLNFAQIFVAQDNAQPRPFSVTMVACEVFGFDREMYVAGATSVNLQGCTFTHDTIANETPLNNTLVYLRSIPSVTINNCMWIGPGGLSPNPLPDWSDSEPPQSMLGLDGVTQCSIINTTFTGQVVPAITFDYLPNFGPPTPEQQLMHTLDSNINLVMNGVQLWDPSSPKGVPSFVCAQGEVVVTGAPLNVFASGAVLCNSTRACTISINGHSFC